MSLGDDAITCEADTNMEKCEYRWWHSKNKQRTEIQDHVLDPRSEDMQTGNYQCIAECNVGGKTCFGKASLVWIGK